MRSRTTSRFAARWMITAALLAVCCTIMPGCIVWEIRDELRTANYRISSLQTELEELQRTNQRLELVRTQLLILERIQLSLANLDDHLSAVRVLISSMSSMMSLFDFSEEETPDPNDPNAPVAGEGQAEGAAPGAAPDGDAGEGAAKPDDGSRSIRLRLKKPPAPEQPAPAAPQPEEPKGEEPAPAPGD